MSSTINNLLNSETSAYDLLDSALNLLEKLEAEHEQLKIENETLKNKISEVELLRLEEINALKSELSAFDKSFSSSETLVSKKSRKKLFMEQSSFTGAENLHDKQNYKTHQRSKNNEQRFDTYNSRINDYTIKLTQYYYNLALHNYNTAMNYKLLLENSKMAGNSAATFSGRCIQETTCRENTSTESEKRRNVTNVHPESDLNRSLTDLSLESCNDAKEVCHQSKHQKEFCHHPKQQKVKKFHVKDSSNFNEMKSTDEVSSLPIWRKENKNNWNHNSLNNLKRINYSNKD